MMTKFDMSVAMAEVFGLPADHIEADTRPSTGAPRPFNCQLDCSRMEALGATERTPFKTAIKECLNTFL